MRAPAAIVAGEGREGERGKRIDADASCREKRADLRSCGYTGQLATPGAELWCAYRTRGTARVFAVPPGFATGAIVWHNAGLNGGSAGPPAFHGHRAASHPH